MKNFKEKYWTFAVIGAALICLSTFTYRSYSITIRAIAEISLIGGFICEIICGILWFRAKKVNKKQDEKEKSKW